MKKLSYLLLFVMLLSAILTACAPAEANTAVVEEEDTSVEEADVEEEQMEEEEVEEADTEEVEEVMPATAEQLDEAFGAFLENMTAYQTLSLDALNEMMIDNPPFLLDVRTLAETEEKGHIPGSVTIPLQELGMYFDYLPEQSETIVSYCGSGWRCTIAMTALSGLGWDVLSLKGDSFGGWMDAGYEITEGLPAEPTEMNTVELDPSLEMTIAETLTNVPEGYGVLTAENLNTMLVDNPDLILIDVRRADEVAEKGSIAHSNVLYIPLEEFVAQRAMWPTDMDAPIAVYCGSGHRSTMAMTILWAYGYSDVLSLKGGFTAWADAGYAVEGGLTATLDEAFGAFLDNMTGYYVTTPDTLNEAMIDTPIFLVDVRSVEEVEGSGHIPSDTGVINVPLRELGENLSYLPDFDTPVVSYCGSGWRATIAITGLGALGWDVQTLKGDSFGGWVEAGYLTEEGAPEAPMAMNTVELDPILVDALNEMYTNIPEGWGVVKSEDLNTMLVDNPDLILIDVRRPEELEENGVIDAPNVISIPLEDFIDNKADWPVDMTSDIVVYCGSGHRSTIAMTILWTYGYESVLSLSGGFGGWADAGFPVAAYEMME